MIKAEYLFLENIYSDEEMKKMKIEKLELFEKKIKKILDNLNDFAVVLNLNIKIIKVLKLCLN